MRLYLHRSKGRTPVWMAQWRLDGKVRRIALGVNERAARAVVVHLEHLLRAKDLGVTLHPPTAAWLAEKCSQGLADRLLKHRLIDHAERTGARPLFEHVDAFEEHLKSKNRAPAYIADRLSAIREAFDACGFATYRDVVCGAAAFTQWNATAKVAARKKRRDESEEWAEDWSEAGDSGGGDSGGGGKAGRKTKGEKKRPVRSASRRNHTASAVVQFCRWMVRFRGESVLPPIEATPYNVKGNRVYERFSLGGRFQLLLDAAHERAEVDCGMDGPTRCTLWWLASETGYRASELGRITPRGISLDHVRQGDSSVRVLLVKVKKTKSGEPAVQAVVTPALIDRVLAVKARSLPTMPMFPVKTKVAKGTVTALRRDLEAAGIPHVDEHGRHYDMHSLRYELGEALLMQNPANNAVKDVMRHSSIELTLSTYAQSKLPHKVAALLNRPMMRAPAGVGENGGAAMPSMG